MFRCAVPRILTNNNNKIGFNTEDNMMFRCLLFVAFCMLGMVQIKGTCTPRYEPLKTTAPLSNFDALRLTGVWFEIANSNQQDCVCTYMNYSLSAEQPVNATLFDVLTTCRVSSNTGTKVFAIGQILQQNPTFEMFLVPAIFNSSISQFQPTLPPSSSTNGNNSLVLYCFF